MSEHRDRWTRFAPSPTGHLHLGHIASALFVWSIAELKRAKVILRIEDHDQTRYRTEFEKSIIEDLLWLGFKADRGVENIDENSPFRQSNHFDSFQSRLDALTAQGLTYFCQCSREQIKSRSRLQNTSLIYDNYCRTRNLQSGAIRLITEPKHYEVYDKLAGQTHAQAAAFGDFILKDKQGQFTYQFAVVCDDVTDRIDLIVRGIDLFDTLGRQLYLHELFNNQQDLEFFHHPLILDDSGAKLSKRTQATGIKYLREQQVPPEKVLAEVLKQLGLTKAADLSIRQAKDVIKTSFQNLYPP